MTWASCIIDQLKIYKIRYLNHVPDNIIEQILKLARDDEFFDILPLAREEEGVGVIAGQHVGGARGALLMPSAGVGNTINALASLAIPYKIPLPMFIGWRGDLGEFNTTQVLMGQILRPVLDAMGIPHFTLTNLEDLPTILDGGLKLTYTLEQPVAFLIATQLTGWKDEK
jgi:sulfopyruvate decarboxylase alpha subunit